MSMTSKWPPTAEWMRTHPDDQPCPRPPLGWRAKIWREERGIPHPPRQLTWKQRRAKEEAMQKWEACVAERNAHATNIGLIVLALAGHEVGDWGDCSINHPITSIVDMQQPAHVLLRALETMDRETAAGIVAQKVCTAAELAAREVLDEGPSGEVF
jgi:hypothetical protein